jgi:hypothetical protein
MTIDQMTERVRAEFLEMPGLRLTLAQVQRLCGIDPLICQAVVDALVDAQFLCVKPDGRYAHLADGDISRRRPANTSLGARGRDSL